MELKASRLDNYNKKIAKLDESGVWKKTEEGKPRNLEVKLNGVSIN